MFSAVEVISPVTITSPLLATVSHATLEFSSFSKYASNILSEIKSLVECGDFYIK